MFVAQMAVGFHAQRAAVLMPKPTRNCRDVHAGLDAARGKQVAQIVVRDALRAGQLRSAVYLFLTFKNLHHEFVRRLFVQLLAHFLQQLAQTAVQRNPTVFAVLGDARMK